MINKLLVGKLQEMAVIEISEKDKPKLLLIPKGTILDFQISSDWPHEITKDSWDQVENYVYKHQDIIEKYSNEDEEDV